MPSSLRHTATLLVANLFTLSFFSFFFHLSFTWRIPSYLFLRTFSSLLFPFHSLCLLFCFLRVCVDTQRVWVEDFFCSELRLWRQVRSNIVRLLLFCFLYCYFFPCESCVVCTATVSTLCLCSSLCLETDARNPRPPSVAPWSTTTAPHPSNSQFFCFFLCSDFFSLQLESNLYFSWAVHVCSRLNLSESVSLILCFWLMVCDSGDAGRGCTVWLMSLDERG